MNLDAEACHLALLSHDPRFDGVFFVGISSTGIYCRPVCPARQTKRENRSFYATAAAAERAGYRPCLRCRPELAPGHARIDATSRLAATAVSRIEDGALSDRSLDMLAVELGVTDRHLRRVVQEEFGVSPVELAQTQRLLTAKRLLTDTQLSVTDVAFASGFSSLRRFNALFRERYRLNPTTLRKRNGRISGPEILRCEIAYRPPLDWDSLLAFLSDRSTLGVESTVGGKYLRTVRIGKQQGWVAVSRSHEKHALAVELSTSLAPSIVLLLGRLKCMFDLNAEPHRIASQLGPLAQTHPGLRVPGSFDGFEMAVRAILGQQVTVKAATTLSGRMAAAFGDPIDTAHSGLIYLSPTAERIASVDAGEIAAIGMPLKRASSIVALAKAVTDGTIALEPRADVERTMVALKTIPGIGEWTAQYVAMRALSWPDAFPHTDLGIMQAMGEKKARTILEKAEAWRPWRSYAVMHLWKSLENGGTKS